jgi:GNAT superfamily N-acetyltransferase
MSEPSVEALDLTDAVAAAEVLEIQRAAYRVEADLIEFDRIPPLHESLDELVAFPFVWLGIRGADGRVAAALAYIETDGEIDIHRLVVAPDRFRDGLGSALIDALDGRARIIVSTGSANTVAHRFYESLGFSPTRSEMIHPDLSITHFVREGLS